MSKRLTAHLLLSMFLAITVTLTACEQKKTNSLNFGLANLPANLDPLYATDATSTRIDRLIYQRLVKFNAAKKVEPDIADWQKISNTQYRFILNDTTSTFHNNQPLTSEDVRATYDFVLDPDNASPHRSSLSIIARIETPDKMTIDFFLNRADPLFPAYLAIGIVPKTLLDSGHAFNLSPVGSGPYRFVSQTEDGKISLLRRRDNLALQFIHVADPTVRVLKLLHDELDILQNDIQPELVRFLTKQKKLNITKIDGSNFSYIGFNMQDKFLKKKAIRQAIAYGLDRDRIIKYVFENSAKKAQAILTANHWAGNVNLVAYEYRPDIARSLLKDEGFSTSHPLRLSFKTSSDPFRLRLSTIYQHQLAKIGIRLDIRSYDWGTFFGDIKAGRFQLYSLSWVGINTPDIFRYTSHSDSAPPKGANRGRFFDRLTDQLIEQAESQTELTDQAKYFSRLQAHLLAELPYVPLWYEDHVLIRNIKVKNYQVSSQGNYDGLIDVEYISKEAAHDLIENF